MSQKVKSFLSPMEIIKRKAKELVSNYVDLQVRRALAHAEEDKVLRYREGALNQAVCDKYLSCPNCYSNTPLKYGKENIFCRECGFTAEINYGIPCLIKKEDRGGCSQKFLRSEQKDIGEIIQIPFKGWRHGFLRTFFGQEIIHFLNLLYFAFRFSLKNIVFRKVRCADLEKALAIKGFYRGYFQLYLKTSEKIQFRKMKKYIQKETLEIGCGECQATNFIFEDIVDSITFGCEYFMDAYLNNETFINKERHEKLHQVIEYHIGGSITSMPFQSGVLGSVVMVHIVDHIVDVDQLFSEISRILKPGGYLLMTSYSKKVFDHLPGVKLRSFFSKKWGVVYKERRITKHCSSGGLLKSDFVYNASGQNLLSINEWKELALRFGFELAEFSFFGKYFSHFMDIGTRGYYNSLLFNNYIHSILSEMIEYEKKIPLSEEDATNVMLVFKKSLG